MPGTPPLAIRSGTNRAVRHWLWAVAVALWCLPLLAPAVAVGQEFALWTIRADDCSGPHRLAAVNPHSDGPPVLLPHQDQDYYNGDGSYSPDGQRIVFYSNRPAKE